MLERFLFAPTLMLLFALPWNIHHKSIMRYSDFIFPTGQRFPTGVVTYWQARNGYRYVEISAPWDRKWPMGARETSICFLLCCVKNVDKNLFYLFHFVHEAENHFAYGRLCYSFLVLGLGITFSSRGFCSDALWPRHTSFLLLQWDSKIQWLLLVCPVTVRSDQTNS